MLQKFVRIRNVGKFEDCNPTGDVQLRRLTLVYAENGRGKTTLCDVLRSLRTGDAGYITGRHSLGADDAPEVNLRLETANAVFKDGSWSASYPALEVYDSTFVHENVYAGDYVDHEHKKNLYLVIVGEKGVKLAKTIEDLDADSRQGKRSVTERKTEATRFVPAGMTLERFLALPRRDGIDAKVTAKKAEVAALEKVEDIRTKEKLSPITLPEFPATFEGTLAKVLGDVSTEAEQLVRGHVAACMDAAGESWVSQGLGYTKEESCPFCDQSLDGNELVAAYQAYFSENYNALKEGIAGLQADITSKLSPAKLLGIQGTLTKNQTLAAFWGGFAEVSLADLDFDSIRSPLDTLREASLPLAREKARAPLEPLSPTEEFQAAFDAYETIRGTVRIYNARVEAANASITDKKAKAESGDLEAEKRALQQLKATKARHEPQADKACQKYEAAVQEKKDIEDDKARVKVELDKHSEQVLGRYQDSINRLLTMFGAGFRIGDVGRRYAGGSASSTYRLVINNVPVDLGDPTTPLASPSFRNTLSAGDRSTLALAFFLARLEQDPDIAQKTIVFDDPFSSQDRSRRTCTQQQVSKVLGKAKQVVVLSHDPSFLQTLWKELPGAETKALQLFRLGIRNTGISEWDIGEALRGDYFENHRALSDYLYEGKGLPRDVVRSIRPLLERYLRFKLPRQFGDKEWLGDMIGGIRDADASSAIYQAQSILGELGDINQYSKTYHHDQNPGGADTEEIDSTELHTFVRRTLDLVGGF